MFKTGIFAIGVLAFLLGSFAPVFATQDSVGCSKAVIVYLDVSGSMSEKRNNIPSIKTGERISLMQAMGELFETLLGRDSGIVGPDDYFELKGFYSKVAPLVSKSIRFKEMQMDVLKTAAVLQKNGLHSEFKRNFLSPLGYKTSFAEVLNDMDKTSLRLMGGGNSYSQVVYILLTDGLDDSGDQHLLDNAFQNNAIVGFDDRQKSKLKVLMFGLPSNQAPKKTEIDVRKSFEEKLEAVFFPCRKDLDTNMIVRTIREQTLPTIEVVQIGTPVPSVDSEEICIPITFANDSCTDLTLKTFSWSVSCTPSQGDAPALFSDMEVLKKSFVLEAHDNAQSIKEYVLKIRGFLPEGDATISVRPETKNGGHGQDKKVTKSIKPYILLRNTKISFSKERDRILVKTMLVNKFGSDLEKCSFHVNLTRTHPEGENIERIINNQMIPYSDELCTAPRGSDDEMYKNLSFEVDLPEIQPGEYIAEVYAHEGRSENIGNTVGINTTVHPAAHIDNISTTGEEYNGKIELQLSLSNSCEQSVTVDAIRIIEVGPQPRSKRQKGRDWKELSSAVVQLPEPIELEPGKYRQINLPINSKFFYSDSNPSLLFQTLNLQKRTESAAYVYPVNQRKGSGLLKLALLVIGLVVAVISYRFYFQK